MTIPQDPNQRWSLDFVSDSFVCGRRFRILYAVDDFSRECVGLQPWSGNLGKRLIRTPKAYVRDAGLVHALLDIESINHLLGHPVVGSS